MVFKGYGLIFQNLVKKIVKDTSGCRRSVRKNHAKDGNFHTGEFTEVPQNTYPYPLYFLPLFCPGK